MWPIWHILRFQFWYNTILYILAHFLVCREIPGNSTPLLKWCSAASVCNLSHCFINALFPLPSSSNLLSCWWKNGSLGITNAPSHEHLLYPLDIHVTKVPHEEWPAGRPAISREYIKKSQNWKSGSTSMAQANFASNDLLKIFSMGTSCRLHHATVILGSM